MSPYDRLEDHALPGEVDLGHSHYLRFYGWHPDRNLNPQYDGIPDIPRAGCIIRHKASTETGWCEGAVSFDLPEWRRVRVAGNFWTVESWEPLTLSPSILCSCGDHGFIREGRWVPA